MTKWKVTMPCGYFYMANREPNSVDFNRDHRDKKGRLSICVFATEGGASQPKNEKGERALCYGGCPCKRKAGRKEQRVFDSKGNPHHWIVLCHIEKVEAVDVADK